MTHTWCLHSCTTMQKNALPSTPLPSNPRWSTDTCMIFVLFGIASVSSFNEYLQHTFLWIIRRKLLQLTFHLFRATNIENINEIVRKCYSHEAWPYRGRKTGRDEEQTMTKTNISCETTDAQRRTVTGEPL